MQGASDVGVMPYSLPCCVSGFFQAIAVACNRAVVGWGSVRNFPTADLPIQPPPRRAEREKNPFKIILASRRRCVGMWYVMRASRS